MKMETFLSDICSLGISHISKGRPQEYLHFRNLTESQIEKFDIGYLPKDFSFDEEVNPTERFKSWSSCGELLQDKLVFPVKDTLGSIVGIHTRTPSHDTKDYMKFYLQDSKASARFFGIENAMPSIWEKREAYLCEGLFDIFPLQKVVPNVLCTLTASVNSKQLDFLTRFVDGVIVAFDNDEQGNRFFRDFRENHGGKFNRIQRLKFRGDDLSECRQMMDEDQFERLISKQQPNL